MGKAPLEMSHESTKTSPRLNNDVMRFDSGESILDYQYSPTPEPECAFPPHTPPPTWNEYYHLYLHRALHEHAKKNSHIF